MDGVVRVLWLVAMRLFVCFWWLLGCCGWLLCGCLCVLGGC